MTQLKMGYGYKTGSLKQNNVHLDYMVDLFLIFEDSPYHSLMYGQWTQNSIYSIDTFLIMFLIHIKH